MLQVAALARGIVVSGDTGPPSPGSASSALTMLQVIVVSGDAGSRSGPAPVIFPLASNPAALAALILVAASAAQRLAMKARCEGSTTSTRTNPGGTRTVAGARRAGGSKPASQAGRGASARRSR